MGKIARCGFTVCMSVLKPAVKPAALAAPGNPAAAPRPAPAASRTLRGFRDVLPADFAYREYVRQTAAALAASYGFGWIDPPVVEEAALFARAAGRHSDIVTKEMFTFVDSGGDTVALRPEFTPGVARAYLEHGMASLPQPVKLAYCGPAFRRERPQHGRFRQFTQFGCEVIGSAAPVVDAQIVAFFSRLCDELKLPPVSLQINSLGCAACRAEFRAELVNYYKPKRRFLCDDCKRRLSRNPLRLLDCKNASCQPLIASAPQLLDWVDEACKKHFMAVLEYLDGMEIPYVLNPYLVRGLDYYTRTVFEVWPTPDAAGATSSLGGGGRYDELMVQLGGPPTPAAGWSMGVDRVVLRLKEQGVGPPAASPPSVLVAQIGEAAKVKALQLHEWLRREGFAVAENFSKDSLKAQLEYANRVRVRYTVILGQKEVQDGTVLLRDMDGGIQEIVDYGKILGELECKLNNGNGVAAAPAAGLAQPDAPGAAPGAPPA